MKVRAITDIYSDEEDTFIAMKGDVGELVTIDQEDPDFAICRFSGRHTDVRTGEVEFV